MRYNPATMRIALAQLNPTVGDIAGNKALLIDAIAQARADGATMLITSEMVLLGYPPRDLLLRDGVVEACEQAVHELARHAGDMHILVGYVRRSQGGLRSRSNSVAICHDGRILRIYDKRLLPGYDVFDEDRYFDPGDRPCVIDVDGMRVGVLICEDMWRAEDVDCPCSYAIEPVRETVAHGVDLLVTMNGSPFVMGKYQRHLARTKEVAREFNVPVAFVNQVGANDDLIFDGRSFLIDRTGRARCFLKAFEPEVKTVNLDVASAPGQQEAHLTEPMRELYGALVVSIRDYWRKTGHTKLHVGLSGGIDSALSAAIAAAALGSGNVLGVMMPSKYSSADSISDAEALALNLHLPRPARIPIRDSHAAMLRAVEPVLGDVEQSLTDQNIQARLRGMVLMALSNAAGSLVLSTSNKSEIAAGYSTLYGDMCGAVTVLGDVTKTRLYELARWVNAHHRELGFPVPPIPENTMQKPPSAELLPDQTDQDTLPPYNILDAIVERYIEQELAADRIVAELELDPDLVDSVTRLIDQAQYKREQAAVVPKVSPRAFGRGRIMPIVMKGLPLQVRR